MKNIFRFITVCMAFGLAMACSKTEQPDEQPQLQLASSSAGTTVDEDGLGADVTFSAAGGMETVEHDTSADKVKIKIKSLIINTYKLSMKFRIAV